MPDISLCVNIDCPFKNKCGRFLAEPSKYWQSYADFKPKDGKCEDFWPIKNFPYKLKEKRRKK